jgi:hypothetical protein
VNAETVRIDVDIMPKSTLALALYGLIQEEALESELETLIKAGEEQHAHEPMETWQRVLLEKFLQTGRAIGAMLEANLARWTAGLSPIRKAVARPARLSQAQVDELVHLVRLHFTTSEDPRARWGIPRETWRRWQRQRIVLPGVRLPEIRDAYLAGRLYQVIDDGTTFQAMRRLIAQTPPTRAIELGIEWAENHAGEYLSRMGERLSARAASIARAELQRQVRAQITGELAAMRLDARGLERRLREQARGAELQRDWRRVAISELRLASNVGRLEAMREQGIRTIYWLVRPDACAGCKALYLESDGVTPKRWPLSRVLQNVSVTGGLNIGRTAALIGDRDDGWHPTGLTHPFCRCLPMPAVAPLRRSLRHALTLGGRPRGENPPARGPTLPQVE